MTTTPTPKSQPLLTPEEAEQDRHLEIVARLLAQKRAADAEKKRDKRDAKRHGPRERDTE